MQRATRGSRGAILTALRCRGTSRLRGRATTVAVLTALAVLFATPAAFAETYTVKAAMETLHGALGSEPHLEHFGTDSAAEKQQLVKALGVDEYLNQQYRSGSVGELLSHYELEVGETGKTEVQTYGKDLVEEAHEVPDASVTTEATGGETLDSASGLLGIEGLGASGVVLIPAAGVAGYYIGERLMEVWGDITQQPNEETGGLGAAVTKESWVRVKPISGYTSSLEDELLTGGLHNPWEASGPVKIHGEEVHPEKWANGYLPGKPPPPSEPAGSPYYALAFQAEGMGEWSVEGPSTELFVTATAPDWKFGDYQNEWRSEGCTGFAWVEPPNVAGWPPDLKRGHFERSPSAYVAACTPYETVGFPPHREYKPPTREFDGMQSYWWRTPAEMPVELPKPTRTCSEECPTFSVPSLPTVAALGERGVSQFPGTSPGEGNEHRDTEEWLEGHPLATETPIIPKATIVEVATKLHEKNGSTELTRDQLDTIAETCLEDTAAAKLDGETECVSLPIFMSGSDVATATEHDLKALTPGSGEPKWVKLNYESKKAKEEKELREWYTGLGGCASTKPEGDACDEYPFYATQQGGGKTEPPASLEWINATDNSEQGGLYGNFVSACGMAGRSATNYAFLAIPLKPSLKIPTTRLCN